MGLSPTLGLYQNWWPAVRWSPSDQGPPGIAPWTTIFPEMAWDPSLFGITILAEFVQLAGWAAIAPLPAHLPPDPTTPAGQVQITAELAELAELVEYRPEVMSEALAQATDMVGYWAGLLMFSRFSHPWTFRLARIAIVVGEFVAMKLKRTYQRARPSQLSPALMPPIAVPGHASFPSGHATQAYLLSGLMALVMPAVVNAPLGFAIPPAPPTVPPVNPAATMLDRLAERVARNREVMGLHYRSDSTAGQDVAAQILTLLLTCPSMIAGAHSGGPTPPPPGGVISLAQREWL